MRRKDEILAKTAEILDARPEGIRFKQLYRDLVSALPHIPPNTIFVNVTELPSKFPKTLYKPSRGLYKSTKYREDLVQTVSEKKPPVTKRIREEDFYGPFAEYLVKELEECRKAIPLGGKVFKDKWGTPDVIGKWESGKRDIVHGQTEIISAEIKPDTSEMITAFGQACAYKLFSHKSYLVVPKQSSEEDLAELDSLCIIFGVGLILFDNNNPPDPNFAIRVRATRHQPDMFYVKHYMEYIEEELFP